MFHSYFQGVFYPFWQLPFAVGFWLVGGRECPPLEAGKGFLLISTHPSGIAQWEWLEPPKFPLNWGQGLTIKSRSKMRLGEAQSWSDFQMQFCNKVTLLRTLNFLHILRWIHQQRVVKFRSQCQATNTTLNSWFSTQPFIIPWFHLSLNRFSKEIRLKLCQ